MHKSPNQVSSAALNLSQLWSLTGLPFCDSILSDQHLHTVADVIIVSHSVDSAPILIDINTVISHDFRLCSLSPTE